MYNFIFLIFLKNVVKMSFRFSFSFRFVEVVGLVIFLLK